MDVTPHPGWVTDLNAALEPTQEAILSTPVVEDAAENRLVTGKIQNFLVAFYPIIRDFPQWLQVLLDRAPDDARPFFEDNIRVERRHGSMWRAMGDGFEVPRERFERTEPAVPQVRAFHDYLTNMCLAAPFGAAVSATNYAVEGIAQKISEKALRGLSRNEKRDDGGSKSTPSTMTNIPFRHWRSSSDACGAASPRRPCRKPPAAASR